jgi:hypothetical protein
MLLRDFGPYGIIFFTMCFYYFRFSRHSWRAIYYQYENRLYYVIFEVVEIYKMEIMHRSKSISCLIIYF